ncbi:LETM1-related biofilm-associated protein [Aequorivita sp. SDUM287046]|uniref:LETM1-related biofilm-associated protein n=1 Tax=Aequorivita aurantiaca TaxID=3053356 RepID=A0ABT8DHA2_9FLAO|nr:LETM1-related biofilm-associated protein [Aequorivita aurantiaca]MDN3724079.1 LETM1-related biofilm-associated protein [Aequorivita aurantiaca]
MNPSAPDWILKFLNLFPKEELIGTFKNEHEFYEALKKTGFIYGISVSALPQKTLGNLKLTKEEFTKINLFHGLLFQFFQSNENGSYSDAINNILLFYKQLEKGKTGFFHKLTIAQSPSNTIEHILSARLQTANSLFKKNTISLLTYALLYLDVLSFKQWQKNADNVKNFYRQQETIILTACFYTLKSKLKKSKYDKLLIEFFESSSEYIIDGSEGGPATFLESLNYLDMDTNSTQRKYLLDLCYLTVWEDLKLDDSEQQFLQQLIVTLNLPESELQKNLSDLSTFSKKYTDKILLFEYSNPVKKFYKHSAATVKLLIIRNKDRLARELEESGELMVLLGHSTLRELSAAEKAKVKEQLLDICKTIPSLTIFLLPGGTVLLPLLVKFIPKLLPSSFQENRIEIDTKKK